MTAGGRQGEPLGGYRPGRSIEHEPVNRAERYAQHTAKAAVENAGKDGEAPHMTTGVQVRGAVRPCAALV